MHGDDPVGQVLREFRTVYADAVIPDMTNEQWETASRIRQLDWQSRHRLSLEDAARCYRQIVDTYNEFDPSVIAELNEAFRYADITVTAAREASVAVYLHVPNAPGLRNAVERFVGDRFRADEVSWHDDDTLRCWWD